MERQAKDGTIYAQVGPDEWKPVTRQSKDGTTYKKVGADEWAPLESPAAKPEMGFLEKLDSYTGAPTRAAIGALQDTKNPITAFTNQFGEDPKNAPTGYDIAKKAGVSDQHQKGLTAQQQMDFDRQNNPGEFARRMKSEGYQDKGPGISNAQLAGVGVDVAADWTNAIPVGLLAKGVGKAAPLAREAGSAIKSATTARFAQKAEAGAEAAAKAGAMVKGGGLEVEQGGKLFEKVAPQSLDELKQWKPGSGTGELVGKQRLGEIVQAVPDLETKPLKLHYDMMENPKSMKELKLKFENLPTKDAKQIAAYNQEMVRESGDKIRNTVAEMAGGEPRNLTDAGNDFIGAVKDKYHAEKEALGPMFDTIQKRASDMNQTAGKDLIQALGENTKIGQLIKQDVETGRMTLAKNTPRTGLSDAEHSVLSRVIDDLNDGMSFKEVQDTREFLRKAIDPANPGASSEIQKVRSVLLGQLEHMAGNLGDDVGKTFKGYAVNERARENVEKIIGGRIESLDAMFAANPDKVVGKVFSNPNYTKVVSEYVGPEKIREMSAAFIQQGIDKATDTAKGFSPEKFRTWLKTNRNFIQHNVDAPTAQRLHALADYGYMGKRFLDEVNPSGTAASLLAAVKPSSMWQKVKQGDFVGSAISGVATKADAMVNQRGAIRSVNEMLGTKPEPGLIDKINRFKMPEVKSKIIKAQGANAVSRAFSEGRLSAIADKDKNDNKSPGKGPEKWAADGIAKLEQLGVDAAELEALKSTKKGREILIVASNYKVGSKGLDNLLEQAKSLINKK